MKNKLDAENIANFVWHFREEKNLTTMKKKLLILVSCILVLGSFTSFPQSISAGFFHLFALCIDTTARAWGKNSYGQQEKGLNPASNVPALVTVLSGITAISGGVEHSLALKNDGTVWAWGHNNYGQLGNGTNTDSNVPVQVIALSGIIAVA